MYYAIFYRSIMRLLHKLNLHYAPPIYPEGDTVLWCQWCGFRQVVKRRGDKDPIGVRMTAQQEK